MKLVVCGDCEGAVSNEADACVHCGKPFVEETKDFAGIIFTIVYTIYILGSGFVISLGVLDVYVRFASHRGLPTADELIVFLLWFLSICIGWLALKSASKGSKERRQGAVNDAASVAIDRHIERRNRG